MKFAEFARSQGRLTDRSTVPVILNHDVAQRCAEADETVQKAEVALDAARSLEESRLSQPRVARAQERLQEAEAERDAAYDAAQQHVYDFTFESLSAAAWDRLVADHPPTDDQAEQLAGPKGRLRWNPETFPVALVASCLVEAVPVAGGDTLEFDGPDDVEALRDQVKPSTWDQLWFAAFQLHQGRDQVPSGLGGSATTSSSETA